jgi:peptidoglycan L-alanyl-D-glutamate endopeptidase CwlK
MPSFSETSFTRLQTCHKDLQIIFEEVIKTWDCVIICGNRGEEEQEEAFKKRASKLHYPNSKHNNNPSLAVDVLPYPIDRSNMHRIILFAGKIIWIAYILYDQGKISHRIRWGGDWNNNGDMNDETFIDGEHFELIKNESDAT